MRFISILRRTVLLWLTYTFMLSVIFLNGTNCVINNGNILTDGRNKRKYIQRKYNKMQTYKIKIYPQKLIEECSILNPYSFKFRKTFHKFFDLCTFVLINSSKTNLKRSHIKQFSFLQLPHILIVSFHHLMQQKVPCLYNEHKNPYDLEEFLTICYQRPCIFFLLIYTINYFF